MMILLAFLFVLALVQADPEQQGELSKRNNPTNIQDGYIEYLSNYKGNPTYNGRDNQFAYNGPKEALPKNERFPLTYEDKANLKKFLNEYARNADMFNYVLRQPSDEINFDDSDDDYRSIFMSKRTYREDKRRMCHDLIDGIY